MKSDLSINFSLNRKFLCQSLTYWRYFAAISFGFIIAQVIVFLFHQQINKSVIQNVSSFLAKNEFTGNPYKTAQAIETLENLGSIRCSELKSTGNQRSFYNSSENPSCHSKFYSSRIKWTTHSLNGQEWEIHTEVILPPGSLFIFWILRFSIVFFGVALMIHYDWRIRKLTYQKNIEIARLEAVKDLARQVAHDIRSPISALNLLAPSVYDGERRVVIQTALKRINDIANDLLKKGHKKNPPNSHLVQLQNSAQNDKDLVDVVPLLNSLILEKRTQFIDKPFLKIDYSIQDELSSVFLNLESSLFCRVISNLINNSVEAIPSSKGTVMVSIRCENNNALISIEDDGIGVPSELLPKLGNEQISLGKNIADSGSGSGLGLYHAKQSVKTWEGNLIIDSKIGIGTKVTIIIPRIKK